MQNLLINLLTTQKRDEGWAFHNVFLYFCNMKSKKGLAAVLTILLLATMSCQEECDLSYLFADPADSTFQVADSLREVVVIACSGSENKGKSIGIFGGSWSCSSWSWVEREILSSLLSSPSINTYGFGSRGYATHLGNDVQEQVINSEEKDIFLLMGTSNDWRDNLPLGTIYDYTVSDGFDDAKRSTFCGGINFCINFLRTHYPSSKIMFLGGHKFFDNPSGYIWDSRSFNKLRLRYSDYLIAERECAERQGVPYMDQFHEIPIDKDNYHTFFLSDYLHHNRNGYYLIGFYQAHFIAKH